MHLTQADIYNLLENSKTIYLIGTNTAGRITRFAVHFGSSGLWFLTSHKDFNFLENTRNLLPEFSQQYKHCCTIGGLDAICATFYNIKEDEAITLYDLV